MQRRQATRNCFERSKKIGMELQKIPKRSYSATQPENFPRDCSFRSCQAFLFCGQVSLTRKLLRPDVSCSGLDLQAPEKKRAPPPHARKTRSKNECQKRGSAFPFLPLVLVLVGFFRHFQPCRAQREEGGAERMCRHILNATVSTERAAAMISRKAGAPNSRKRPLSPFSCFPFGLLGF